MHDCCHPIVHAVRQYVAAHSLLHRKCLYLVALSGGADSVALLRLLVGLGYRVEAAHCNFHLRGAESDRDEAFAHSLCEEQHVPFHVVHFDTRAYASLHKVSIEMAARNLRYAYFEQLRQDIGAAAICVAHHREDSVETVLINLLRGTGLHGLCGIRPVNGHIVRPLLGVGRRDIESFLASLHQPFVTDSTNLEADVVRNKIRLQVMPLLRDINPSADLSIWRTTERMAEAAKVFDRSLDEDLKAVVETVGDMICVRVDQLRQLPSAEYVLFRLLGDYGFRPQQVEAIHDRMDAPTGKVFSSATHAAVFDRGRLLVGPHPPVVKPLKIPEEGIYLLADGLRRLKVNRVEADESFSVSRDAGTATLDASDIHFPLMLRPWQAGDRFVPFGMTGSKLVSDYLTDKKKNYFEKRRQLVVADATDAVLWLVGERTDNRYRVTRHTVSVCVFSLDTTLTES